MNEGVDRTAEGFLNRDDQLGDGGAVGQVARETRGSLRAGLLAFHGGLLQRISTPSHQGDSPPIGAKTNRERAADSGRCAGDQNELVGEKIRHQLCCSRAPMMRRAGPLVRGAAATGTFALPPQQVFCRP